MTLSARQVSTPLSYNLCLLQSNPSAKISASKEQMVWTSTTKFLYPPSKNVLPSRLKTMLTGNSIMTYSTLFNISWIIVLATRKAIYMSVRNRNRSSSSKRERWTSSHRLRTTPLSSITVHHQEEAWKSQPITSFHRKMHIASVIIINKSSRKRPVL